MRRIFIFLFFVTSGMVQAQDKVLVLGDSHTEGLFGDVLDSTLRTHWAVATYGVGGSVPEWYLRGERTPWGYFHRDEQGREVRSQKVLTPKLGDLLTVHSPSRVVVALGTNFIWTMDREAMEKSTQAFVSLLQAYGILKCVWVGPPALGPRYDSRSREVAEILSRVLAPGPCRWVDSRGFTEYPAGGDEIHYDAAGDEGKRRAREWALQVESEILRSF